MNKHFTTVSRKWPESTWKPDEPDHPIWKELGIENKPAEIRGQMETSGPWQMIRKYRAVAMLDLKSSIDKSHYSYSSTPYYQEAVIYSVRSLLNARESGYELEGRVKVGGKRFRAFTSTFLLELTDGHLINIANLYVCQPD